MRLLVDEDLPRSLVQTLRSAGLEAQHVIDVGLRGRSDDEVFDHALSGKFALLTADIGFGNLLRYPLGSHAGVIVARFPNEVPTSTLAAAIVEALGQITDEDLQGSLVIIEPGRVRLRKKGLGQA